MPVKSKYKAFEPKAETEFALWGRIYSNPIKTSSEKYYSCDFRYSSVKDLNTGLEIYGSGLIKILIPSDAVEAFFPGKLYSSVKNGSSAVYDFYTPASVKGSFLDKELFLCNFISKTKENNTILEKIFSFRTNNRINLKRLMFAWGGAGALLMALLTGMKEYTDKNIAMQFRKAGLSHILALSGMHLNLFSGLAKKLEVFKLNQVFINLFQIAIIFVFVWFAGLSPSLIRATIFSYITIAGKLFAFRKMNMINTLAITFLIHICIRPYDAFEMSFILSYGALAGILLFSEFNRFFSTKTFPAFFADSFSASLGAQGITAPVCLKQTGVFTGAGIIATVFISPLITVFIYSGLFLILLCLIFPDLVPYSAFLMKILYTQITKIVAVFSAFPSIQI